MGPRLSPARHPSTTQPSSPPLNPRTGEPQVHLSTTSNASIDSNQSRSPISSSNSQNSQAKLGYTDMIKAFYEELVKAIIRPPRSQYQMGHLGPVAFRFCEKSFKRTDLIVLNERGMGLQCSHWQPVERPAEKLPCVIFMHGNSSSRAEAIDVLNTCFSIGCTVFAFDFSGSGMSDGEYVSLGYFEKDDLKAVMNHLRQSDHVSTIGLWGHSMGAATALLHGDRDPSIAAMVVDSSFADLEQLAIELSHLVQHSGLRIPGFLVSGAMKMIRSTVIKRANFDIKHLSPIKNAPRCYIPALFAHAEGDEFIKPHHSEQICEQYAGDKNLVKFPGDHNSPRPSFLLDSAAIFLQRTLQIPEEFVLTRGGVPSTVVPWGAYSRYIPPPISDNLQGINVGGDDDDGDDENDYMSQVILSSLNEHSQHTEPPEREPDPEILSKLNELGFSGEQAKESARRFKDINRAVQ